VTSSDTHAACAWVPYARDDMPWLWWMSTTRQAAVNVARPCADDEARLMLGLCSVTLVRRQ